MKTLIFGTAFALAIAPIGSTAYAKEPVPANRTTGGATNQRLEVIQQYSRDGGQGDVLDVGSTMVEPRF